MLQKMHARAKVGTFFPCYYQKMRKGEFFKKVIISIEIQVYEIQKKNKKKNFLNLELDKIMVFFLKKKHVCARGGEFFCTNT